MIKCDSCLMDMHFTYVDEHLLPIGMSDDELLAAVLREGLALKSQGVVLSSPYNISVEDKEGLKNSAASVKNLVDDMERLGA